MANAYNPDKRTEDESSVRPSLTPLTPLLITLIFRTTKMLRLLTQSFVFTITLASIASASTWGLGSGWSIGSAVGTSSPGTNSPSAIGQPQTEIVKVQTTFNPGIAPSGQFGDLLLWPGLSNGTGDLLQTTVESWPDQSWCGGSAADWYALVICYGTIVLMFSKGASAHPCILPHVRKLMVHLPSYPQTRQ